MSNRIWFCDYIYIYIYICSLSVSAYRSLSAFKTYKITDILKHDTLIAVCCERGNVCAEEMGA